MKWGYARVSTTGQNLAAQIAALEAAGVEKIFQEKASGKDRSRPALRAVLSFARDGDEIVVARLDHFTRSSADLHAVLAILQAKGVTVTFLDNPAMNLNTAHGELLLGVLAAAATFERRLILARTSEGRASSMSKGVKFGRPSVISDQVAKRIAKLRAEGELSAGEIANAVGVSRRTVYRAIADK